MPEDFRTVSASLVVPELVLYTPPRASLLAREEMSAPLMLRPVDPEGNVRSSTLIQLPALASELMLIVHWLFVTAMEVTMRTQPLLETGRLVRCSVLPQFFSAMYAEFWPPPERTQAVRV